MSTTFKVHIGDSIVVELHTLDQVAQLAERMRGSKPSRSGDASPFPAAPRQSPSGAALAAKALRILQERGEVPATELASAAGLTSSKALGNLSRTIDHVLKPYGLDAHDVILRGRDSSKQRRVWRSGERIDEALEALGEKGGPQC